MNHEMQCCVVSDLLPLYVDDLTSEATNLLIKKHLEECPNCQKEYTALKAELESSAGKHSDTKIKEINYLKKISLYQKINLILGAVVSFLLGACIPVLIIGISVLLRGTIPDYYFARFQLAWYIGFFKMAGSGVMVCVIYLLIMLWIRRKVSRRK